MEDYRLSAQRNIHMNQHTHTHTHSLTSWYPHNNTSMYIVLVVQCLATSPHHNRISHHTNVCMVVMVAGEWWVLRLWCRPAWFTVSCVAGTAVWCGVQDSDVLAVSLLAYSWDGNWVTLVWVAILWQVNHYNRFCYLNILCRQRSLSTTPQRQPRQSPACQGSTVHTYVCHTWGNSVWVTFDLAGMYRFTLHCNTATGGNLSQTQHTQGFPVVWLTTVDPLFGAYSWLFFLSIKFLFPLAGPLYTYLAISLTVCGGMHNSSLQPASTLTH